MNSKMAHSVVRPNFFLGFFFAFLSTATRCEKNEVRCLDIGCCSAPDFAQLFFSHTKLKSLIFNICPTLLFFVQRTCARDECQLQAAENQPQIAGD